MTAHAHAHTTRMSAWVNRLDGSRELVYESYEWSEPINAQFDTARSNPEPGNGINDGAHSGILTLQRGEFIDWECQVENDLDQPLQFANEAYTAEMCNLFGFVAPGDGNPWSCFVF